MEQKMKDIEQWYEKNKALYEQFSHEVEEIITKILKSKEIPYQSVSHRVKEKESFLNKCKKENRTLQVYVRYYRMNLVLMKIIQ